MAVALVALFIALGSGAYAATNPPANSVGTKQLKNVAVTNAKLANNSVGTDKIKEGAIGPKRLENGAVTAEKVKDGSLAARDFAPGQLPSGPQGPQGAQGPAGAVGPPGPGGGVGQAGPQGPIGPAGPQGIQGPQGVPGSQGPQGERGPEGTSRETSAFTTPNTNTPLSTSGYTQLPGSGKIKTEDDSTSLALIGHLTLNNSGTSTSRVWCVFRDTDDDVIAGTDVGSAPRDLSPGRSLLSAGPFCPPELTPSSWPAPRSIVPM